MAVARQARVKPVAADAAQRAAARGIAQRQNAGTQATVAARAAQDQASEGSDVRAK